MVTVKRITDLTKYATVLPYASEMFGVFQPLLGWKSKRIEERFKIGFENDKNSILERLKNEFTGLVDIQYNGDGVPQKIEIRPGALEAGKIRSFESLLLYYVSQKLPSYEEYDDTIWDQIINYDELNIMLNGDVLNAYREAWDPHKSHGILESQLKFESAIAGALVFLVDKKNYEALKEIFYAIKNNNEKAYELLKMYSAESSNEAFLSIDNLDPQEIEDINSVALSPISVVHLFRQYFFELDTFLGPPVKHVWLSPGATIELIEVHSRKAITEKTLQTTLDIIAKSEKTTTDEDEISTAVKVDNRRDVKFAASVSASYGSVEATSSLDLSNSQQTSRERAHKHMRQQTDKLSSEIRKNVTTTFKTVTEVFDQSSSRYTLSNTTDNLINYELRTKMRQVCVQVQDGGTYLCWLTYVDDPGKELGLSKLVHIAKPPELESIVHPESIPLLEAIKEEKLVTIPFISTDGTNADNEGEVYKNGIEVDDSEFMGSLEKIQSDFNQEFICPKEKYILTNVEFDPQGIPVQASKTEEDFKNDNGKASFTLHLDSADFQGQNSLQLKLILHWSPEEGANDAIKAENEKHLAEFKEKERAEYEKAYVEAVRERVEKASKIMTRDSDELREEERIVVYRKLIQEMLLKGVPVPDDRTRHVISEVINSIFDVEKMLYFVAPEWWRPRLFRHKQQLKEIPDMSINPSISGQDAVIQRGLMNKINTVELNSQSNLMSASTVGWGGINDVTRDNYLITESSEPAKLGSSLGWLLQLDGDNMRNAFLNAPWVKAVIPIRPGKEQAAINWLKGVEGMNGVTDDVIYHNEERNEVDINGVPYDGKKLIYVIEDLGKKIKKKYEDGKKTDEYPKPEEVSDPNLINDETVVTATPIDRVYEHGFFPLEKSFRLDVDKDYQIFDQWLEILPTDQIVAVEVKYDPKTGRQIDE